LFFIKQLSNAPLGRGSVFSAKTNPHNAQIIFTYHSIEVLSSCYTKRKCARRKRRQLSEQCVATRQS